MEGRAEAHGPSVAYEVDYRDVKYPRLEYKTGSLLLVLPKDYENEDALLEKHRQWIVQKGETILSALKEARGRNLNTERTDEEFRTVIKSLVETYRKEFDFVVGEVYFRRMRTKWGSYSSKGNLTVNTLLRFLPERLVRYVIFHELVHSLERRHNERFWGIVKCRFEDYREREEELLVYWLMLRNSNRIDV